MSLPSGLADMCSVLAVLEVAIRMCACQWGEGVRIRGCVEMLADDRAHTPSASASTGSWSDVEAESC